MLLFKHRCSHLCRWQLWPRSNWHFQVWVSCHVGGRRAEKAILVVFANKQDMEQAMTPSEMANALGLPALKDRKWQIFKTSATKGTGLDEAMEWLVETLKSRQWAHSRQRLWANATSHTHWKQSGVLPVTAGAVRFWHRQTCLTSIFVINIKTSIWWEG